MSTPKRYAEGTSVPAEKTRIEIEKLLRSNGATQFASYWDSNRELLEAMLGGRRLRFSVPLMQFSDAKKKPGRPAWDSRTDAQATAFVEAERRRRWRVLLLQLKGKLEAIATGDANFDREFLGDIVTASGSTVADVVLGQLGAGAPLQLGAGSR